MKRALRYIMVAVAMTALAAACTKEEIKDDTDSGQEQEVVPEGFVSNKFSFSLTEILVPVLSSCVPETRQ